MQGGLKDVFQLIWLDLLLTQNIYIKKKRDNKKLWMHRGVGGESEFISSIAVSDSDFEFLCNNCTLCYVKHNELHRFIL